MFKGDKALNLVILESYKQGVFTRNIMNVVESLGIGNISSYVSSPVSALDAGLRSFLEMKIERPMKFICIDATYFKTANSVIQNRRWNENHSFMT
jgi:transposase-like protein